MDYLLDKFIQVFPMFQPSKSVIHKREDRNARCHGGPRPPREDVTLRIAFEEFSITLVAWPSRGGYIVLQRATAVDFDFLGLDRVDPRLRRHSSESAEDDLCRRLLLLGAKWWDSCARYHFFRLLDEHPSAQEDLEEDRELWLTLRERRWVSVGWPSDPRGGLCVAEFDTNLPGIEEVDNQVPDNATSVLLARDMDERCEILKRLGAKFYGSLAEYEGATFLKSWEEKIEGEIGPLVKYPVIVQDRSALPLFGEV